ncbi:unnamed protein product [Cylindrotheca closterium]|uniref:Thiaminase-2/PQQC domain-containing protein n=1 Tax=Cylindrotheca closterium TaxID=2856 RepID=A0AAD2CR36_9STRA|nr:unnamed protein product [Cylindrotheca closterium]
MSGLDIISKIRQEAFNQETDEKLISHPYLKAAENGILTLAQRQAFAREQYHVQLSDARSFAVLAGHEGFAPSTLTGASVPEAKRDKVDLFQFLLGGEVYAAPLLLNYATKLGLDEDALQKSAPLNAKSQAYPSYWARLALSGNRAAGAAACAVNFPAWGQMCRKLLDALKDGEAYEEYKGDDDDALAFVKFFATPIDDLDKMAAAIIDEENATYEEIIEPVRLLQQYEIMFWDGIFEAGN